MSRSRATAILRRVREHGLSPPRFHRTRGTAGRQRRARSRAGLPILLVLSLALASPPRVAAAHVPGPEQVLDELIRTYNLNRQAAWNDFIAEHYAAGWDRAEVTRRWLRVHSVYGSVDRGELILSTDTAAERWLFGRITKNWFAIELRLDEQGRIRATGLLQGERPPGDDPACDPPEEPLPGAMDRYLAELSRAGLFPGAAMVRWDGGAEWAGATAELSEPDGSTVARPIASVTKVLTATAIMELVRDGALALDQPLSELVPEYPSDIARAVTVGDLLNHRSGIELDNFEGFNRKAFAARNSDELLALHLQYLPRLRRQGVRFGGRAYDYSNEGYDLAALIVERLTRAPLEAFLAERVYKPARMTETHCPVGRCGPSGVRSTPADLVRLMDWLRATGRLAERFDHAVSVGPDRYALGLRERRREGYVGHAGGRPGVSAELRYHPEAGATVAVVAARRGSARVVADRLADMLRCSSDQALGANEVADPHQ